MNVWFESIHCGNGLSFPCSVVEVEDHIQNSSLGLRVLVVQALGIAAVYPSGFAHAHAGDARSVRAGWTAPRWCLQGGSQAWGSAGAVDPQVFLVALALFLGVGARWIVYD